MPKYRIKEPPIIIPRPVLLVAYFICIYIGTLAIIAGVPVFTLTAPRGYGAIWGTLLVLSALVSAVAVVHHGGDKVERWSAACVWSLVLAYAGALNGVAIFSADLDRYVAGGIATGFLLIPLFRFLQLARQAGKRHAA